jgi:hypothetical protein
MLRVKGYEFVAVVIVTLSSPTTAITVVHPVFLAGTAL